MAGSGRRLISVRTPCRGVSQPRPLPEQSPPGLFAAEKKSPERDWNINTWRRRLRGQEVVRMGLVPVREPLPGTPGGGNAGSTGVCPAAERKLTRAGAPIQENQEDGGMDGRRDGGRGGEIVPLCSQKQQVEALTGCFFGKATLCFHEITSHQ